MIAKSRQLLRSLLGRTTVDPLAVKKAEIGSLLSSIEERFPSLSIVYLDIGASGGSADLWRWMISEKRITGVLIDMADWGNGPLTPQPNIIKIKAAVAEFDEDLTVSITRHPACSSCLPPNHDLLNEYPVKKWFEVVRTTTVHTESYEHLVLRHHLPQPQFIKMDVQGFEGQVLRGMGAHLKNALCVEFECQMKPIYAGQDTFFDLYQMMNTLGFRLRDLKPQGPFEGEALEFNCFWSRTPKSAIEESMIKLWEKVTGIWPGIYFRQIDAHQQLKYRFNTPETDGSMT